jgi:hypothetical protein
VGRDVDELHSRRHVEGQVFGGRFHGTLRRWTGTGSRESVPGDVALCAHIKPALYSPRHNEFIDFQE